jgi:hypothetical protein
MITISLCKRAIASLILFTVIGVQIAPPFALQAHADDGTAVAADTTPAPSPTASADVVSADPAPPEDSAPTSDTNDTAVAPTDSAPAPTPSPAASAVIASTSPDTASSSETPIPTPAVARAASSSESAVEPASSTPEANTTVATTSLESVTTGTDASQSTSTLMTDATSSGPTIQSGDSVALANILNIVNTNFLNSNGSFQFANYIDPVSNAIDLRGDASSTVCTSGPCVNGTSATVSLNNDASITNALLLQAATGGNNISASGSAAILTGNAYAGLNLINLANLDFINSNYLLVALNAFKSVTGDIVFPSLANFFHDAMANTNSPLSLNITTQATVDNGVTADANTGNNATSNASTSSISSGNALAYSTVFNQLNATLANSGVTLLFHINGAWNGTVFNAPVGLISTQNPDGSFYLQDNGTSDQTASGSMGPLSLTSSSTAKIQNQVSVSALTGQNQITDASTALISTGDAYAGANIINIANGSVIGKNWLLAIVNIFGDFNGNISFGQPDLWVGDQVSDAPSVIQNGTILTHKITVVNRGDANASQSRLTDTFDPTTSTVLDSSVPFTNNQDGTISWDLKELPAGDTTEITYTSRVTAPENTSISDTAAVSEYETDANAADNSDSVTVHTYSSQENYASPTLVLSPTIPVIQPALVAPASTFTVTRQTVTSTTAPGTSVHEKLTLDNTTSSPIDNVRLDDVLTDSNGIVIHDDPWNLGTVAANEEITIEYDVDFSDSATPGAYSLATLISQNDAAVSSFKNNGSIVVKSSILTPTKASVIVGQVLGAAIYVPPASRMPLVAPSKVNPVAALLSPQTAHAEGTNVLSVVKSSSWYDVIAFLLLFGLLYVASRPYIRRFLK